MKRFELNPIMANLTLEAFKKWHVAWNKRHGGIDTMTSEDRYKDLQKKLKK